MTPAALPSLLPISTQVLQGISWGEETCSPALGATAPSSCRGRDALDPPGARDASGTSLPPPLPARSSASPAQTFPGLHRHRLWLLSVGGSVAGGSWVTGASHGREQVPARGTQSNLGHPQSISKPLALWFPQSSKLRVGVGGCHSRFLAQSPPSHPGCRSHSWPGGAAEVRWLLRYRVNTHQPPGQ